MGSRLAVRNMACMLVIVVMKWKNGVAAAAHEQPREQADKNMGVAESFVVFTTKRRCLTTTGAGGGETENGEGDSCSPPTLSSILMVTLGGEPSGTSLDHLHEPFTLCSELLDVAFDAALKLTVPGV